MDDIKYCYYMAQLLEHVSECFDYSKPPYKNEKLAESANTLRWEVIEFLEGIEENE